MSEEDELLSRIGWRVAERWRKEQVIWLEPAFIHDFGDRFHHMSMIRTCDFNEEGELVRGTGPSEFRFWLHKFLDDFFFYPIRNWMSEWIGDNDTYSFLRNILGFFWGLNCGFPARDVALHAVWYHRGCHREKITMKKYEELLMKLDN